MRVVFLGYGELGANVLRGIADHHEVLMVLTHPSHFARLCEPDLERVAADLALPLAFSTKASEPGLHQRIRDVCPQVIVSTNWRTTVPPDVLCIPPLGAVNVHDALLPYYAGFGAVNWAIRNGEDVTGLTVHYMDEKLDTGPVIERSVVKIGPQDTAAHVLERLLAEYVPVTLRALELVERGFRGEPQVPGAGSFYHRIRTEDTRIDWRESATDIYNLIRGQSDPFVNAWTMYEGARLWVKSAKLPNRSYGGTPGRIVRSEEGGVVVASGRPADRDDRGVLLMEVATQGGSAVPAADLFTTFGGYLS
jgi:methionyl-tRNA formyltransferase